MEGSEAAQQFDVIGYGMWVVSLLLRIFVFVPAVVFFVGIVVSNDFNTSSIVEGLVEMLRPDAFQKTQAEVNHSVAGMLALCYWTIVIFHVGFGCVFGLFESPPAKVKGDQE
jgi:cellulose synthase/poly-beta-1,6-N-acetylglucosamine synthase-like glycosyltransferase